MLFRAYCFGPCALRLFKAFIAVINNFGSIIDDKANTIHAIIALGITLQRTVFAAVTFQLQNVIFLFRHNCSPFTMGKNINPEMEYPKMGYCEEKSKS